MLRPRPLTITSMLPYNNCRTCLTNRMRFISCHITPLVSNSLRRGHTHANTHANTHTYDPHSINFKKPGTRRPVAGARLVYKQICRINTNLLIVKPHCQVVFLFLSACHHQLSRYVTM